MRKRLFLWLVLPFLVLNISGCTFILVGAAGALGAYGISKDTIQGDTDRPYESLWSSALNIAHIRGTIKEEDAPRGYIEMQTESSKVWIRLIRLTRLSTRVRISARKFHFPNLELAQDMYVKIVDEAR
jgi:hypothetical protein